MVKLSIRISNYEYLLLSKECERINIAAEELIRLWMQTYLNDISSEGNVYIIKK